MESGKSNIATLIIILAVVVVIVGVIWLVFAQQEKEAATTETLTVSPTPTATPTATVSVSATPTEVNIEQTSLVAVEGKTGSGSATRDYNDETGFVHEVTATLPDLPEGEFYEGWLVTSDNSSFFSTGKMTKFGDTYTLTYTADTNQEDYPLVVITLEKTDDQQPETHIIEGNFGEMLSF